MSDFTSKMKGAVDKATSAAKEMAQDRTDIKDKPEQNPSHDDNASYNMEQGRMADDGQYANVSEFNMSPISQDSQNLFGSMEQAQMGPGEKKIYDDKGQAEMGWSMKDQMYDSRAQAETGSSTKDKTYDSRRTQTEMGQSTLPTSQCMPEPGSAAKRS